MISKAVQRGTRVLVEQCAVLTSMDRALIVSDENTQSIGEIVRGVSVAIAREVKHIVIPPFSMHGQEPPPEVAAEMARSSVVFCLTKMSMAHSRARLEATLLGVRCLSLPDYSMDVLASPAMAADFQGLTDTAMGLADRLTGGCSVEVRTEAGTSLRCDIAGRRANSAPGWCWEPGSLASPPDAETNIAVVEDGSEGQVVVDGSVPCPELGLLESPLRLKVKKGYVVEVEGDLADRVEKLFSAAGAPVARIVAELGIGLNPLARLCGVMLEDEGCMGTVHLGVGSNATIGGTNSVPFHLDFVLRSATVEVDGHVILQEGRLIG
jgi:2,5-dihydroxypyridine 5,6-dioxygenase